MSVNSQQKNGNILFEDQDDCWSVDSGSLPFAVDLEDQNILCKTENKSNIFELVEGATCSIHEMSSMSPQDDSFFDKKSDSCSLTSNEPCFSSLSVYNSSVFELLENERIQAHSSSLVSQPSDEQLSNIAENVYQSNLCSENVPMLQESLVSTGGEETDKVATLASSHVQPRIPLDCNAKSMNYSCLMRQADAKSSFVSTSLNQQNRPNCEGDYINMDVNMIMDSNYLDQNKSKLPTTVYQPPVMVSHWPQVEKLSAHSFQVSVAVDNVALREAMDVVCNPDLLRLWLESIDALVVTDHKGGKGSKTEHSSSDVTQLMYEEPSIEDLGDSVIVPPALPVKKSPLTRSIERSKDREEYDGEWIVASTSEIIPPSSHINLVEGCVRKTREMFGFNQYGSVSMFIERNLNQVSFTVGPYKGDVSLSHKIMFRDLDSGRHGVRIIDQVKIVKADEIDGGENDMILCSCLESMKDVLSTWFEHSVDGYVEQTQRSLMNLIDLIDRGGENSGGRLILAGENNGETKYNISALKVDLKTKHWMLQAFPQFDDLISIRSFIHKSVGCDKGAGILSLLWQ
eukprot:scaffold1593_cov231-Chaetoceros_neogracile.AAC.6